jgi:hypothetical protein
MIPEQSFGRKEERTVPGHKIRYQTEEHLREKRTNWSLPLLPGCHSVSGAPSQLKSPSYSPTASEEDSHWGSLAGRLERTRMGDWTQKGASRTFHELETSLDGERQADLKCRRSTIVGGTAGLPPVVSECGWARGCGWRRTSLRWETVVLIEDVVVAWQLRM